MQRRIVNFNYNYNNIFEELLKALYVPITYCSSTRQVFTKDMKQ